MSCAFFGPMPCTSCAFAVQNKHGALKCLMFPIVTRKDVTEWKEYVDYHEVSYARSSETMCTQKGVHYFERPRDNVIHTLQSCSCDNLDIHHW